jgi:hypothetical protein
MVRRNSHIAVMPLIIGAMLTPVSVFGAKDCRVVEYADHYEAVCVGDPDYSVKQPEQKDSGIDATKGALASKKRQRIGDVRSLNAHRFDSIESQAAPDTIKIEKQ